MQTLTLTLKAAKAISGSLGNPSKMPGRSYGISAHGCKVGSKLAKIVGSVCHGCYALKANYSYPSVVKAHITRAASLYHKQWVPAMVKQIGHSKTTYFRWHDSGDIQSFQHLLNIVAVCEALPAVSFWLPTKEKGLINKFVDTFGTFPANLVVRLSGAMVDGDAPTFTHTSTVHNKKAPIGTLCEAYTRKNVCGDCRACWDKSVANVSYKQH